MKKAMTRLVPIAIFMSLVTGSVHAQPPIGLAGAVTVEVEDARILQNELAEEQDIVIRQIDDGARSVSAIDGIPIEFRNQTFENIDDIEAFVHNLYPYYGFVGAEALVHEDTNNVLDFTRYRFREYIEEIPTTRVISIYVFQDSGRLSHINGSLYIDSNISRAPELTESQAIDVALDYAIRTYGTGIVNSNGNHRASLRYFPTGDNLAMSLGWNVTLERSSAQRGPGFLAVVVLGDGSIIDGSQSDLVSTTRACDGTWTVNTGPVLSQNCGFVANPKS